MASSTLTCTGTRPTALTVPTTQNTAPVIEHRCLYTHDVRRKAKRWQDGILRFHTFNKRVMVYDVPRNFIGDTHWRNAVPVQDGDEFEMDRGVLVQVGEAVGSTEQDLSELLDKRKKPRDILPAEPVSPGPALSNSTRPMAAGIAQLTPKSLDAGSTLTTSTRPIAAEIAQLRPKSLNAVLGTPKGRIGRAILPTKSPYEQRRAHENDGWAVDRPLKRVRVDDQADHRPLPSVLPRSNAHSSIEHPQQVDAARARRPRKPREHQNAEAPGEIQSRPRALSILRDQERRSSQTERPIRDTELHTIAEPAIEARSKEAEPARSRKTKTRTSSTSNAEVARYHKTEAQTKSLSKAEPARSRATETQMKSTSKARKSCPSAESFSSRRPGAVQETIDLDAESEGILSRDQGKVKNKLQMASRKRRKKLLYRDPLPQDQNATDTFPGATSRSTQIFSRHVENRSPVNENERRSLSNLRQEEQERLDARLRRNHDKQSAVGRSEPLAAPEPQDLPDHSVAFARSTVDDPNHALANMDEVFLSRAWSPEAQGPQKSAIPAVAEPTEDQSRFPIAKSLPRPLMPLERTLQLSTGVQVPSSPDFQTQCQGQIAVGLAIESPPFPRLSPKRPLLSSVAPPCQGLHDSIVVTSKTSSPPMPVLSPPYNPPPQKPKRVDQPQPSGPVIAATKAPQLTPGTEFHSVPPPPPENVPYIATFSKPNLPNFKPQKPRSPLKKALSDITTSTTCAAPIQNPSLNLDAHEKGAVVEQVASPWSKEAWDLFGCGRDGFECSYQGFKERIGSGV